VLSSQSRALISSRTSRHSTRLSRNQRVQWRIVSALCPDGERIMNMFLEKSRRKPSLCAATMTARCCCSSHAQLRCRRRLRRRHTVLLPFPNTVAACLRRDLTCSKRVHRQGSSWHLVNLFLEDALFHHGFEKVDRLSKSSKTCLRSLIGRRRPGARGS
jgi:hypothetical protein